MGSLSIHFLFNLTTIFTFIWIVKKFNPSRIFVALLAIWLLIQSILGIKGFYMNESTIPPRFVLMVLPPILFILILLSSNFGKTYLNNLSLKNLTLIHAIRIPIEIVLWALYEEKLVPQLMTFEGANFDILSGISAPFVFYYLHKNENYNKFFLIVWNVFCLILLLIIVTIAVLSAPSPLQQLAFEQPNIGVLQHPFNWLPSFIVPVVLFCHLASLRLLILKK